MRVAQWILLIALALATGAQNSPDCVCPIVRLYGGWCDVCNVGYIAGLKIPSKLLFETLHNHGHDVDRKFLLCESCRQAIEVDGFCGKCGIGFVEEQGYFSRLAYELAKGKAKRLESIACDACKKNVGQAAWCDACQVGMLGNVAITDRAGFEAALPEFRRLQAALAHLDKCETCAVAIACNGVCEKCRISYYEGQATPLPPPAEVRDRHE